MASASLILTVIASISIFNVCFASRILTTTSVKDPQGQQLLQYHNGPLLSGEITVNLIWYGDFTVPQRAIVADFITSLSASSSTTAGSQQPSVAAWLKIVEKHYYHHPGARKSNSVSLLLGKQVRDFKYSLGKSLSQKQIVYLASKGGLKNAVNVVLTAKDVAVDGFCVNRCGTHGYKNVHVKGKYSKFAYVWVGNSETQCPGLCAWPFHQPMYGPQVAPLIAPNNDVGLDGIVMSLSGLLAGTVTNPFGNGYYQGSREAPLEAATACTGVYGKGAYPGYPGKLLVDHQTGASYNAHGANGRKYLLPALFDPSTSTCSTLL